MGRTNSMGRKACSHAVSVYGHSLEIQPLSWIELKEGELSWRYFDILQSDKDKDYIWVIQNHSRNSPCISHVQITFGWPWPDYCIRDWQDDLTEIRILGLLQNEFD